MIVRAADSAVVHSAACTSLAGAEVGTLYQATAISQKAIANDEAMTGEWRGTRAEASKLD